MTVPTTRSSSHDVQAASRAAVQLRLKTISFAQLSAQLLHADGELGTNLSFDISRSEGRWLGADRELRVIMPFRILIQRANSEGVKTNVAEISIVVRLDYAFAEGAEPADEELQNFAAISGFMHAWPYVRAEVQSLSAKIGFPPLTLPVVLSGHAEQLVNMARLEDGRRLAPSGPSSTPGVQAEPPTRGRRAKASRRRSDK